MAAQFDAVKLNFKSSAYSTAVTQLESKLRELNSARDEYDKQRDAIPQFWSGDAEDEAYQVICANIENVKTAYKAVEENMKAFKDADESANAISSETKQKLEDARKKVQSLFQS